MSHAINLSFGDGPATKNGVLDIVFEIGFTTFMGFQQRLFHWIWAAIMANSQDSTICHHGYS